jgi:hypothetical protein
MSHELMLMLWTCLQIKRLSDVQHDNLCWTKTHNYLQLFLFMWGNLTPWWNTISIINNFGKTKGTTWPYCFGNQWRSIMDDLWIRCTRHVNMFGWYGITTPMTFILTFPQDWRVPYYMVDSMLIILFKKMLLFFFSFPNDNKMWRQILKLSKIINLSTNMCWSYQGVTICFYIDYDWFKVHIIYMLFRIQLRKKKTLNTIH